MHTVRNVATVIDEKKARNTDKAAFKLKSNSSMKQQSWELDFTMHNTKMVL